MLAQTQYKKLTHTHHKELTQTHYFYYAVKKVVHPNSLHSVFVNHLEPAGTLVYKRREGVKYKSNFKNISEKIKNIYLIKT